MVKKKTRPNPTVTTIPIPVTTRSNTKSIKNPPPPNTSPDYPIEPETQPKTITKPTKIVPKPKTPSPSIIFTRSKLLHETELEPLVMEFEESPSATVKKSVTPRVPRSCKGASKGIVINEPLVAKKRGRTPIVSDKGKEKMVSEDEDETDDSDEELRGILKISKMETKGKTRNLKRKRPVTDVSDIKDDGPNIKASMSNMIDKDQVTAHLKFVGMPEPIIDQCLPLSA